MAVNYTPEQQKCVESLIGPIDVSAGAGSGKTFTLTQRIARALAEPDSGVDDIDQVCAITFTEKAAAELKGRVRSTLRAQGLFDQASKVDDAWISTIHGMCSRILRTSALELGLDPKFQVMSEAESAELLAAAVDDVLAVEKEQGSEQFALLLREYPFEAQMGTSISGLLAQIISAASALPGGLDDLIRNAKSESPSGLAKRLLLAFEELQGAYAGLKPGKVNDAAQANIEVALEALRAFLASGSQDVAELTRTLDQCVMVRKCGSAQEKEAHGDYKAEHLAVSARCAMLRGGVLLEQLIGLAREADAVFRQRKRAVAQLDNNDLICEALRALNQPAIHERYANKFRLVMIDEFQDTDSMQIAIAQHLCGPQMRYLCTVGDAQQSIYGFRGADVAVYRAHQKSLDDPALKQDGARPSKLMLSRNFRSHGDVLAFVKTVCAQPQVFGDSFLDLGAVYDGAGYQGKEPRIQLNVAYSPAHMKTNVAQLRQVQANQIADYFRRMHEGGHKLSDMVLLLGSTTHADLFAQAVRNQGFDCIIAGGSLFARAAEVQAAVALLGAIVNPRDGKLAYQALSSDAFALSADDLLTLATYFDDETELPGKRSLDKGLRTLARLKDEGEGLSPALSSAVEVMSKASRGLRKQSLHQVLQGALLDSGWIARLQARGAEGVAAMGNLMKAVRMVQQLEEQSTWGPVTVARRFRAQVEAGMKEAPGALNAQDQDAVRIMTIHASKGLEFPVVALAEFDRAPKDAALVVRRVEGRTYASLKPANRKVNGKDSLESTALKAEKERVDLERGMEPISGRMLELADGAAFHGLLGAAAAQAEREEAQRLFYVGATRAKEALGVFMCVNESKTNPEKPYEGLIGNIRSALFGAEGFPEVTTPVEYGGSEPALFAVSLVDESMLFSADAGAESADGEEGAVVGSGPAAPKKLLLPKVLPLRTLPVHMEKPEDSGLFSYSSIASAAHAKGEDATFGAIEALAKTPMFFREEEEGSAPDRYERGRIDDADKATDFGTVLHRTCECAVLAGADQARSQVSKLCETYAASEERVLKAFDRWIDSRLCARSFAHQHVLPEVPFSLQVGPMVGSGVMQGEIDLLCVEELGQGPALVVDYKTGGKADETAEQLQAKHALQAQCYALAVLSWGYDEVELVFARVEQSDTTGQDTLQTVRFAYDQNDREKLQELVRGQAERAGAC